jgi:hypothetical protein
MNDILKNLQQRFSDAPWMHPCDVCVVGLGAVGQGVALSLLANGYEVHAFDYQKVNDSNVIPQQYKLSQVGTDKVFAFLQNARDFIGAEPHIYNELYNGFESEVIVSAVDNMVARKQIFETFKASKECQLFIDARMLPNQFQVFCVTKDKIDDYESHLFNDDDIPSINCSFKSSRHNNQLIHGYITWMVCNYVTNRELGQVVYDVPFLYEFNPNYLQLCNTQY